MSPQAMSFTHSDKTVFGLVCKDGLLHSKQCWYMEGRVVLDLSHFSIPYPIFCSPPCMLQRPKNILQHICMYGGSKYSHLFIIIELGYCQSVNLFVRVLRHQNIRK